MKDLLTHSHQMMYQFGFEGVDPHASSSAEYMEGVMELNCCCQVVIYYPCHRLPQDLHQTNYSEFAVPLWDQDVGLTGKLLCGVHLAQGGLYHTDNLPPLSGFR